MSTVTMVVSNITLVKIGAVGGILTVSMGFALRRKMSNDVKQLSYYKDALKTLRSNRGAVYLLGEPIKDGNIDIANRTKNYIDGESAKFEVPIKGPKQKGTLHLWAQKQDEVWNMTRIELGLANEPNRHLLIKGDMQLHK